jgi:CBS domain-containing protein
MTRDVKACRPEENLARAAQLMWDHDCGCVPVVDEERRVVGIVTDRDVCMATLHAGRPLHELLVTQAMARKPVRVGAQDDIHDAQELMRQARVRRLPVTDGQGRLIGLLSLHDLARQASNHRWFAGLRLRDIATTFAAISRPWRKPPLEGGEGGRTAYAE